MAEVLEAVPELVDSYNEHLNDNGELLPYVYLPDAVRTLELKLAEGKRSIDACTRLAWVIENALVSGGAARNLALLGLTDEIASAYVMSRMRGQPSLLDFMHSVLSDRAKRVIRENLDSPTASALLRASDPLK